MPLLQHLLHLGLKRVRQVDQFLFHREVELGQLILRLREVVVRLVGAGLVRDASVCGEVVPGVDDSTVATLLALAAAEGVLDRRTLHLPIERPQQVLYFARVDRLELRVLPEKLRKVGEVVALDERLLEVFEVEPRVNEIEDRDVIRRGQLFLRALHAALGDLAEDRVFGRKERGQRGWRVDGTHHVLEFDGGRAVDDLDHQGDSHHEGQPAYDEDRVLDQVGVLLDEVVGQEPTDHGDHDQDGQDEEDVVEGVDHADGVKGQRTRLVGQLLRHQSQVLLALL